jgi:imidazole glycerol phosphate synthase glutamine amidotransferase subunit
MKEPVVIVPTGTANLASVEACFKRLGYDTILCSSAEEIEGARRVVLPGVGTFGSAASRLNADGIDEALRRRFADGRPTMAICVGMQLLAESSEESPNAAGLGVLAEKVTSFEDDLRVPQLGWNLVKADPNSSFFADGWAYFANSYKLTTVPPDWTTAATVYGSPFVSGMERGNLLACQFHPELSGDWGASIVSRWLRATGGVG